jgi:NAD(P)-dependent dehydrogenase (short-subunit alcohol dehydrogenase family)
VIAGDRLFLGANRGIGLAMLKKQIRSCTDRFFVIYRDETRAQELLEIHQEYSSQLHLFQIDPTYEQSWEDICFWLQSHHVSLGHLFNSIGILSNDCIRPEKSLRDINQDHLLEILRINTTTIITALKHLQAFIKKDKSFILGSISAKVGSIEDNHLGGWYSYRASKAAHNMLIKTLALEYERRFPKAVLLALHPGTVDTELSRPFASNIKHDLFTPEQCADYLYKILEQSSPSMTGQFLSWDGSIIPW